ncbi:MAG: hypothetical protein ACYTHK_05965 [Planctomycetota bacterium]|jgi:hypothetical protein
MKRMVLAIGLLLVSFGCARYYKIVDPETKKVYYTRSIDKRDTGSVVFRNAETDAGATIEGGVVHEITEEEYEEAIAKMAK